MDPEVGWSLRPRCGRAEGQLLGAAGGGSAPARLLLFPHQLLALSTCTGPAGAAPFALKAHGLLKAYSTLSFFLSAEVTCLMPYNYIFTLIVATAC